MQRSRQSSKGSEIADLWESWKEVRVTQKLIEKTLHLDILGWNFITPEIEKSFKASQTRGHTSKRNRCYTVRKKPWGKK